MKNEDFTFDENAKSNTAPAKNGKMPDPDVNGNCGVCPLRLLPPGTWEKLTRRPFRKRHPVIFWGSLCIALFACFFAVARFISNNGEYDEQLALVSVTGPIMDPAPTLGWIRQLANNPHVKGILLRVDSPGGGAAASQEIYSALARLAEKMPIAVSMGATAASGGLMVSMAGQKIFANPSTITGSIGVRMDVPQLQGLMGKLGIGQETLVTAPWKDAISYLKPLTPEDRAYLENVLMNMHGQFVEIVAKGRRMSQEKAKSLANGKICTGQQALKLGLVDELGGQTEAQAWLAKQTGVPADRKLLTQKVSKTRLLERLFTFTKALGLDLQSIWDFNAAPGLSQPAFYF